MTFFADDQNDVTVTVSGWESSATCAGLSPETEYDVTVRATTDAMKSTISGSRTFETLEESEF